MTVMGLFPVDIWHLVIMSSISMRLPVFGLPSRGHSVWWNWVTVNPSICLALTGCKGVVAKNRHISCVIFNIHLKHSSYSMRHLSHTSHHTHSHSQVHRTAAKHTAHTHTPHTYLLLQNGELADSEVTIGGLWGECNSNLACKNVLISTLYPGINRSWIHIYTICRATSTTV